MTQIPLRLAISTMLVGRRAWGVWVGAAVVLVVAILADSLVPREPAAMPTVAYVTLGLLLPTVWVDTAKARTLARRTERILRVCGGIGFLILGFPLWLAASPDNAVPMVGWIGGSAVLGAWSFGGIAAIRVLSPMAGFFVIGLAVAPLLIPKVQVFSTAWLWANEPPIRWIHVCGLILIGLAAHVGNRS